MTAKKFDSELNGPAEIGKVSKRESQKQLKGDKDQSAKSVAQRVQTVSLTQLFYVT